MWGRWVLSELAACAGVPDARRLVRVFIAIATLAPAVAFVVLGGVVAARGGTAGGVAGVFLMFLGLGLVVIAVLMLRAPGAAQWFLRYTQEQRAARGGNGKR